MAPVAERFPCTMGTAALLGHSWFYQKLLMFYASAEQGTRLCGTTVEIDSRSSVGGSTSKESDFLGEEITILAGQIA